ncbi:hypothetical protein KK137_05370 [Croceibacterium sp. LX-88]|uniref:Uncharacterized protein n=1 Tax=Croceibacterium selenioxidans TaxID=2838833 RepID=A0ABS5W1W9_9SPHN|nr:hypothetical protein [Croceibacterium selenioxidans]MBT2133758.1 hypothetical protein [Croceibacterium selenioxidans]
MNAYAWVSMIALVGWLVLAAGSYRAHRIGAKKTIVMALAWGSIVLLVAAFFSAIGR